MSPPRTRAERQRVRRGGAPADAARPSGRQLAIAGLTAVVAVVAFIALSGGGSPSPSASVGPDVRQSSHVRGSDTAPITIEEWADFQCPACGMFARATEFIARSLRELHANGCKWIEQCTQPAGEFEPSRFPDATRLIRDITTMGARVAKRATEKALTVDQWSIAYRFGAEDAWDGALEGFHRLEPPKGWFWADPFPIQVDGRNYIFFEELPLGAAKAHISVVEVDRDGRASEPMKVLERDYHLSYPFLVEEDGQLYMIPETAGNGTVEVYRCEEFPARWKLERVLLRDVRCVDATLHRLGERWWMFVNTAVAGGEFNEELHLYSSPSLLGDWQPHRKNPVKCDVRGARPAGSLFWNGNRLFRPGQICTPLYGSGITVNRITRLTLDEYQEEEDHRIEPREAGTLGIHTFNRAGDLTVTDAFERRSRF